jgi:inosine/xanthosine triphosphatase
LRQSKNPLIIALGSDRAAKINALSQAVERIATVDENWRGAQIVPRAVETHVAAMPLSDDELMCGARNRALAVGEALKNEGIGADLWVGLEGGFHSLEFDGVWRTYLHGWAYATDGERGWFGGAPSVEIPPSIARRVIEGKLELGDVIDQVAGEHDVRSRQGTWGVLSRDLLTRSMSFEAALIAALAPFYNANFYS